MKIGELATATGVTNDALRFYEQRGLIAARRSSNGYRDWAPETVDLVRYIRTAQQLGFTLQEIGEHLPGVWTADDPTAALARLFSEKVEMIDARIEQLQQLRVDLLARSETACPLRPAPAGAASAARTANAA